jgi:hypothetical protein
VNNEKLTKLRKKKLKKPKKRSVNLKRSSEKDLALLHLTKKTTVTEDIIQGGMMNLIDISKKRGKDLGQEMRSKDTMIVIKEVSINQVIVIMKKGEGQEVEIIIDTKIIKTG